MGRLVAGPTGGVPLLAPRPARLPARVEPRPGDSRGEEGLLDEIRHNDARRCAMVLDQLIAEAEIALRQRQQEQEEAQRVRERKRAEAVEEARESLIAWLGDLWDELRMYEVDSHNRVHTVDGDVRRVEYGIKFSPPQIAQFWAIIRDNHFCFSTSFDGYEVERSALGEFLLERRRVYEKHARQRARDLEVAEQVIAAAREFLCRREEYDSACQQWAEHWTASLWRPWTAWLVRYVPIFSSPTVIELRSHDHDEIDLSDIFIHEAMVLGDKLPTGQTVVPVVTKYGERQDRFIGALLDARLVRFDSSSVSEPLEYHRRFYAGKFCVNIQPEVVLNPSMPPQAPVWSDVITRIDMRGASQDLMSRIGLLAIDAIAQSEPDELVDMPLT